MLNGIIDRPQDFPTSGTLALRSETPGARITRRNGGEEVRVDGGIRSIRGIKEVEVLFETDTFAMLGEGTGGVYGSKSRCFNGFAHNGIDCFFFVVPCDFFDE
jgi:hypothetical protein